MTDEMLTPAEVTQVAALARLALSASELEELTRDLGSILDHMRELTEADVAEVAPMRGVSDHPAPFREDEPGADPLIAPPDEFAPVWTERFFTVPRLAALDADALADDARTP